MQRQPAKAEAVPVAAATDDCCPSQIEHFYELRQPEDCLHDSFRSEDRGRRHPPHGRKTRDDPDGSLQPARILF